MSSSRSESTSTSDTAGQRGAGQIGQRPRPAARGLKAPRGLEPTLSSPRVDDGCPDVRGLDRTAQDRQLATRRPARREITRWTFEDASHEGAASSTGPSRTLLTGCGACHRRDVSGPRAAAGRCTARIGMLPPAGRRGVRGTRVGRRSLRPCKCSSGALTLARQFSTGWYRLPAGRTSARGWWTRCLAMVGAGSPLPLQLRTASNIQRRRAMVLSRHRSPSRAEGLARRESCCVARHYVRRRHSRALVMMRHSAPVRCVGRIDHL